MRDGEELAPWTFNDAEPVSGLGRTRSRDAPHDGATGAALSFLAERCGQLRMRTLDAITDGIRLVLDL